MKEISDIIQEEAQKNERQEGPTFVFWQFEDCGVQGKYYEFSEERLWVLYNKERDSELDLEDTDKTLLYLRSVIPNSRDFVAPYNEKRVRRRLSFLSN